MKIRSGLLWILFHLSCNVVFAQTFPVKPIVLTVPFPPGGLADLAARTIAGELHGVMGQLVIVENRPGASGALGINLVDKATPDGYRLLLGGAELVRERNVQLVPVGLLGTRPSVIAIRPDLVGQLREQKTTLRSFGAGYVDGVVLRQLSRVTAMRSETYKGSMPALTDLSEGRLDVFVGAYVSLKPFADSGRVKIIATTSQPPNASNRIPGLEEAGFQPLRAESFLGLFAPKGTPQVVINRLGDAMLTALKNEELRKKLSSFGIVVRAGRAEALQGAMTAVAALIPNPCKVRSECVADPSCNPPECPVN